MKMWNPNLGPDSVQEVDQKAFDLAWSKSGWELVEEESQDLPAAVYDDDEQLEQED